MITLGAQSFAVLVPVANVDCCIFQKGCLHGYSEVCRGTTDPWAMLQYGEQASPPHRHMLHAPHTHTTTVSQMTKAKLTSRGHKIVTATLDEEWKKLTAPLGKEAGTALCF
jgi:hypothetical protein